MNKKIGIKILAIGIALLLIGGSALAQSPTLDESLFGRGKEVLGLLSYSEFDKAFAKAAFKGNISSDDFASFIWENFYDLFSGTVQKEVSVFCYDGLGWTLYIPVLTPSGLHGEVLTLASADGKSFSGYGCVDLTAMNAAAQSCESVIWNMPYAQDIVIIQTDE